MPKSYLVGTRGSLLALTQCKQVIKELESLTGDSFEIQIVKTQGDQDTTIPLWQMEGQNFFTKELDQALIEKKVDLVVHSYKDLGSERPPSLHLAAVTKRNYAHDVLLIKKETINKLNEITDFIVGTSSPRRIKNLTNHLGKLLPTKNLNVTTRNLRGNVNSRILKLISGDYHAIVLALAGLERLSNITEIMALANELTFMVLPLSLFPTAASQGALAIEVLKDNCELIEKLKKVQDPQTFEEVNREREAFKQYGGGCHLAVGITVKKISNFFAHFHHGELNNEIVYQNFLEGTRKVKAGNIFNGNQDPLIQKIPLLPIAPSKANFYVTSPYCFDHFLKIYQAGTIWTAGAKSMEKLAGQGIWVNGCADSLGDLEINLLKNSKFLSLMIPQYEWKILTSDRGYSSLGEVIACYGHKINTPSKELKQYLYNCDTFFWTSFFQYQTYSKLFPEILGKNHCCGLGKTYNSFKQNNIEVTPYLSYREFYEKTQ